MPIVTHLGNNSKEYREIAQHFYPDRCPDCDHPFLSRNGGYPRLDDENQPIRIYCFICKRCQKSFSVIPDFLSPNRSYPIAVQEAAVTRYAAGLGTCAEIAKHLRVSTTTVWRWVEEARLKVSGWINRMKTCIWDADPAEKTDIPINETLRPRWHSRRIRLPGKIDHLLILERLPAWVAKCREIVLKVAESGRGILPQAVVRANLYPQSDLHFCRLILPKLIPAYHQRR